MAKIFNSLTAIPFPLFCGTKSLHHRLRLRKSFVGWNWLLYGSALKSPITLVQSPLSVQHIKTVQWPKHSTHSLHLIFPLFCGTKSLHHRLTLRKWFVEWQSDSKVAWLLVTHILLYKVHSLLSVWTQSTGWNFLHTRYISFSFFFGDQVCVLQIKTRDKIR